MSLDEQFASAQTRVKGLTSRPTNEDLLSLYAFFKQATAGDVSGARPGIFSLKERAKYDAWATKKGLSADDSKTAYVALVDRLVG
jgi:diazepam-binding inhibitor (GABA receptor modulating acyl-CoA-binding protein)